MDILPPNSLSPSNSLIGSPKLEIDLALASTVSTTEAVVQKTLSPRAPGSQPIAPAKLNKIDVFNEMRTKICMVEGPSGKGTGFFLNTKGLLATNLHCIPKKDLGNGMCEYQPNNVKVLVDGESYSVVFPSFHNIEVAQQLDLCLLEIVSENPPKTSCFSMIPESLSIQEGMTVYFAGYPITQTNITFHKGTISSLIEKQGVQYFTIDGTVVPGNSGGPVTIQYEGKLYLAGIIYAEVADINPGLAKTRQELDPQLDQANMIIGPIRFNVLMKQVIHTIFNNLSTGIGKAIHIASLAHLSKSEEGARLLLEQVPSESDFPVVKKDIIVKEFQNHRWYKEREGHHHEIWTNGKGKRESLGRHKEIPKGTAEKILKTVRNNPATEEKKG